ncbi:MAG: hypothetical protein Q4A66_01430 [Eubacteriales bacterium]|nr:hypothetical protein [Eubacteriales bacterium]
MLYPKSNEPRLSGELFKNPTCEYRGTPFWAWNGKLKDETLGEQIEMLKTMGMGGFHMHVRTGMDSPYLDDDFMSHIRYCIEKARSEKMLAWLYDEDRWPSGTAGGKVTAEHPEYAKKTLLFTSEPYAPDRPNRAEGSEPGRGHHTIRQDNGELLAVYDVCLGSDGTLESFRRIGAEDEATGEKWYAYMEHATDDPWFNDHPYVDTLKPEAIDEFIQVTHEQYKKNFAADFGSTAPAIFTDEPQFTPKAPLAFALEKKDVFLPWTDELPAQYASVYDEDLLDSLPELVWELPDRKLSRARYRFHNLVAERFARVFCDRIGDWCTENGILLTGHVMGEPTLNSQTQAVGDAMRCYPSFGLPGIDMLCDFHEYNTAKQTQSIVHQQGAPGMLSELYGVTGWDYDFRGYKLQGDWQAALGVTVRVPHLTWMTMKGEAKRDYPSSIGYQSPWWDQYAMVEDHFARLNTAMTRGKAKVRVAVVHPIESYWLYWGPSEQTAALRSQMDEQFARLTETLLFGQIDFDFISEACLPKQCEQGSFPLKVGEMEYDAVLVCGSRTLRSTTLERLQGFKNAGGKLVFIGACPDHIDAEPSDAVQALYAASAHMGFDASSILKELDELRFIDVRDAGGQRVEHLIYQLREDNGVKWLFVANGKNPVCPDVEDAPLYRFILSGGFRATEYDTMTGETRPVPVTRKNGRTTFERVWHMHDSVLLQLEEDASECEAPALAPAALSAPELIMKSVQVTLDEPNMLLLDMAEYALDDGEYRPLEELLRLDNAARAELGIPLRRKEVVQPYLIKPEKIEHSLRLRFTIPCEYEVAEPLLALEDAEETQILLNGEQVPSVVTGWFVDKDIQTVALPKLPLGENILEIRAPIGRRTNLEYFYLLGDFGVRVNGIEKTVVAPVRRLGFGSVVPQNLPFYSGNINYHFDVETTGEKLLVRVPHYRGGLVKVFVDGEDRGNIAFSPYTKQIDGLAPGRHSVMLKLYGVRQNGFAQLHFTPGIYFYQSPNSWRSAGDRWTYEYQFKPMGILKSPELYGTASGRAANHITDAI